MEIVKFDSEIKPSALQLAMDYRGYTQNKLCAEMKDLSQPNLSKFLNGNSLIIPKEKLERIMIILDFPFSFLYNDIKPLETSLNLHRKTF